MNIKLGLTGVLLVCGLSTHASLYNSGTLSGGVIPDNNSIGLSSSIDLTTSAQGTAMTGLTFIFVLQGGDSADISGYLRLGNETTSPYYNLTSLIQGQSLSAPTTYTIDFNTADLQNTFGGLNPNDTWTLFFADAAAGDQTALNSWSLQITAVPEPANLALGVFAGCSVVAAGIRTWKLRR